MPISRFQTESNNSGITKYQIQDNINNDKLIRHQVMLEGGGSEPILETLNVIENGTYIPPAGVDGYNEINVDVPSSDLPDKQLISEIKVIDGAIYDTIRCENPTTGNVTINDDIMTFANNSYIQTMIGLSDGIPALVEIDIDNIPEPTEDARGITLINFSPRGGDNIYLGYDNRSTATNKTYYMYGSSGYAYPNNPINYDYFDNETISIYYNCVYNTNVTPNRWTKNLLGYNSNIFRIYKNDDTTELLQAGRSGAFDEIQNLKIGRPNYTMTANIKAIRVYLLNNVEIITL